LLRRLLPIVFVILYFLSPIDIVPDFLVGPGWIDDLVLIALLIWFLSGRPLPFFSRFGNPYQEKHGAQSQGPHHASSGADAHEKRDPDDPYAMLGVKRGATTEEIKAAYRVAVAQYHPDKVAHLGEELQELAHRKFVAIQKAYEQLMENR
jgi:uncharacterized membrane protein YkvA (DUF1232 family)